MDYGDGTVELPSLGSMEITFNTLELGRRLVPVRKAKVYWEGDRCRLQVAWALLHIGCGWDADGCN